MNSSSYNLSQGTKGRKKADKGKALLQAAQRGDIPAILQCIDSGGADVNEVVGRWTALHKATAAGQTEAVRTLLQNGAAAQVASETGETPLHLACEMGLPDECKLLLDRGADVNAQTAYPGETPLHRAVIHGQFAAAELLINHNKNVRSKLITRVDINKRDYNGVTPLHDAATYGHLDICELLLEGGATAMTVDFQYSKSPLQSAAEAKHHAIVKLFLQRGMDPRVKDKVLGLSPLHLACEANDLALAKLLLLHGADVKGSEGAFGHTPLHTAAESGHAEISRLLIGAGADVAIQDTSMGFAPVHKASKHGHYSTMDVLMEGGADINVKDGSGGATALHHACANGDLPLVRFLLAKGAELRVYDTQGFTPLHRAAQAGHFSVISELVRSGLSPDTEQILTRRTPLHEAAENGRLEAVVCLVGTWGACMRKKDSKGYTPKHIAYEKLNKACYWYLLRKSAVAPPQADRIQKKDKKDDEDNKDAGDGEKEPWPTAGILDSFLLSATKLGLGKTINTNFVFLLPVSRLRSSRRIPYFQDCFQKKWLDTATSVDTAAKVLFVSHRWLGDAETPDPQNKHYSLILLFLEHLEKTENTVIEFVWIDYSCVLDGIGPQYPKNLIVAMMRSSYCLFLPAIDIVDGIGECSDLRDLLGRGWAKWESLVAAFTGVESYCYFQREEYQTFKKVIGPTEKLDPGDNTWLAGFVFAGLEALSQQESEAYGQDSSQDDSAGGRLSGDTSLLRMDRLLTRARTEGGAMDLSEDKKRKLHELWVHLDTGTTSTLVGYSMAALQKWRYHGPLDLFCRLASMDLEPEDFDEAGPMTELPLDQFGKFSVEAHRPLAASLLLFCMGVCMDLIDDFDLGRARELVEAHIKEKEREEAEAREEDDVPSPSPNSHQYSSSRRFPHPFSMMGAEAAGACNLM